MIEATFQRLEDRQVNIAQVFVSIESGCSVADGEYSVTLAGFIGSYELDPVGGETDVHRIRECVHEHIDEYVMPEEGCIEFILIESGEWQDVFWHKYYEIVRATELSPHQSKLRKKA